MGALLGSGGSGSVPSGSAPPVRQRPGKWRGGGGAGSAQPRAALGLQVAVRGVRRERISCAGVNRWEREGGSRDSARGAGREAPGVPGPGVSGRGSPEHPPKHLTGGCWPVRIYRDGLLGA